MNDGNDKPNGRPLAEVKEAVLAAAKAMYRRGIVEGTAGNVSGRVDDGTVVVTPSSLDYEAMALDDLVVVDLDGAVVAGERSPTSEKGVHLAALAAHPEAGAVVHCHAKHASMFAVARQPIPAAIDEFVVYIGGDVPVCEYHPSGQRRAGGRGGGGARRSLGRAHGQPRAGHDRQVGGGRAALGAGRRAQRRDRVGRAAVGRRVELPDKARSDFTGVYDFIRHQTWRG